MKRLYVHVGAALAVALILSFSALGQITQLAPRAATVIGSVIDLNGHVISNATVVLREVQNNEPHTTVATSNGRSAAV